METIHKDTKKILVLGAASVHVKLIKAAQEMGLYVITTDNVPYEKSPGKQVADEYWDINIFDVYEIVNACKQAGINGVISGWLDPCQKPYQQICEALNLPCYGTEEQFYKLTNKKAFKALCREYGVGTIKEYTEIEALSGAAKFPLFVKPVDSRGSRGQSVCYTNADLRKAIQFAQEESSNGEIVIEEYVTGANEFQVSYFFKDGTPFLLRTTDSYCGSIEKKLDKVVSCSVSPSRFTEIYIQETHLKVINMLQSLRIINGPVFMQGFEKNGEFYFFDPGFRFPGVDYEKLLLRECNVDLMKAMLDISLYGKCENCFIPEDLVNLHNKRSAILFPTITEGTIKKINGENEIMAMECTVSFAPRYKEGSIVKWTYNVNQRIAEIDLLCENTNRLCQDIKEIQKLYTVVSTDGVNMIYDVFDASLIK